MAHKPKQTINLPLMRGELLLLQHGLSETAKQLEKLTRRAQNQAAFVGELADRLQTKRPITTKNTKV